MWIGNCWRDSLEGATNEWISDLCRGVRRVIARPAAGCWFPRCRTGEFQVTTKMKLLQSNLTWKVFFFLLVCRRVVYVLMWLSCSDSQIVFYLFFILWLTSPISLSTFLAVLPCLLYFCLSSLAFTVLFSIYLHHLHLPPLSLSLPFLPAHVLVHQSISVHTDRLIDRCTRQWKQMGPHSNTGDLAVIYVEPN